MPTHARARTATASSRTSGSIALVFDQHIGNTITPTAGVPGLPASEIDP